MLRDGVPKVIYALHTAARGLAAAVVLLALGFGSPVGQGDGSVVSPIVALDGGGLVALYADITPEPSGEPGYLVARFGFEEVRREVDRWSEAGGRSLTVMISAPAPARIWTPVAGAIKDRCSFR